MNADLTEEDEKNVKEFMGSYRRKMVDKAAYIKQIKWALIKDYEAFMPIRDIEKKYHMSDHLIRRILTHSGVKKRKKGK